MPERLDPDDIADDTSTAGAVGWMAEGLVRDWLRNGTVLFGLIALGAGVSSGRPALVLVGTLVGVLGAVLPFVAVAKRWARSTQWLMVLVLLAAEVVVMWLAWG